MSTQLHELVGLMVYLAAPYSDPVKAVVEYRMQGFCEVDAILMERNVFTCSPLSKHFILQYRALPGDWAYWGGYSENMLKRCDSMIIITMPGWETSTGVAGEIEIAKRISIPIYLIGADGTNFRRM